MKKFRVCLVAAMLIVSTALAVRAVRLSKQEPATVQTPQAKVKVFNNTVDNRWVNVPIEITSLGGYNYRVTNKTKMGIRRFIIDLRAPDVGKLFHVEGAHQHRVLVRVTDQPSSIDINIEKPIAPEKSIDINIEKHIGEFSGSEHQHADQHADKTRIEMMPYIVDFADQHSGKRWKFGDYLRSTADGGWDLDPDLNPKVNRDLVEPPLSTQGCYVYDYPVNGVCLTCNTGDPTCDGPYCKRPTFRFKSNRGGVHLAQTCVRCTLLNAQGQCDEFGPQCAHDDGSPCAGTTLDLDPSNPC